MLRIEQSYLIKATAEQVWRALTVPELMSQWSGQPAEYDARVGGSYRLWTDYVTGEIVACEPSARLAQTWKPNNWTITDSVVTFTLTPVRGGTRVDLVHENVQPEDFEGTQNGWKEVYVGAIKKMLEQKPKTAAAKGRARKKTANKKKPMTKTRATAKKVVKRQAKSKSLR